MVPPALLGWLRAHWREVTDAPLLPPVDICRSSHRSPAARAGDALPLPPSAGASVTKAGQETDPPLEGKSTLPTVEMKAGESQTRPRYTVEASLLDLASHLFRIDTVVPRRPTLSDRRSLELVMVFLIACAGDRKSVV